MLRIPSKEKIIDNDNLSMSIDYCGNGNNEEIKDESHRCINELCKNETQRTFSVTDSDMISEWILNGCFYFI